MKLESLVIADQHAAVNTFPGLVHTARHVTKVGNTRSRWPNPCGGSRRRWGWRLGRSRNKVAYRKVRLDHLLSKELPGPPVWGVDGPLRRPGVVAGVCSWSEILASSCIVVIGAWSTAAGLPGFGGSWWCGNGWWWRGWGSRHPVGS